MLGRRSPTLILNLGKDRFRVKKTDLLERLGLFQDQPALLGVHDYEVQTDAPREHFEEFVRFIKGDPIVVSESTCDSFCLFAEEFRFELLSAACTEFLASQERNCDIDRELDRFEVDEIVVRPVTIRVGERSVKYEILDSARTIMDFADNLGSAIEDDIRIEGVDECDDVMTKAVEAVYCNTVASLGDWEAAKPTLAWTLWRLREGLCSCCINGTIYCLNQLHRIGPTAFDKAQLLLLSQCERGSDGELVPRKTASWSVIRSAMIMLKEEKNGRRKEATELLRKVKGTERFDAIVAVDPGTRQVSAPDAMPSRTGTGRSAVAANSGVKPRYCRTSAPAFPLVNGGPDGFLRPAVGFNVGVGGTFAAARPDPGTHPILAELGVTHVCGTLPTTEEGSGIRATPPIGAPRYINYLASVHAAMSHQVGFPPEFTPQSDGRPSSLGQSPTPLDRGQSRHTNGPVGQRVPPPISRDVSEPEGFSGAPPAGSDRPPN
jgi:hypothetical protein